MEAVGVEPTSEDLARAASTSLAEILLVAMVGAPLGRLSNPASPLDLALGSGPLPRASLLGRRLLLAGRHHQGKRATLD